MLYQVLNNKTVEKVTAFYRTQKNKLCFNFIPVEEGTKRPLELEEPESSTLRMRRSISARLSSNSSDAWEAAILFSNVFIHGSDILNNLCVPMELQSKLILYHIP